MKMKNVLFFIPTILLNISLANCQSTPNVFPILSGQYLGQTPPDEIPKLFLPELFINVHSSPAFAPDGKSVYWRSFDQKALLFMEEVDGVWSAPQSVPFKSLFYKQDVPFFSKDGEKLYFITTRPQHWYQLWSDEAIWYVQKEDDGWSGPQQVSEKINALYTHWQFSVSENGNIYLSGKENDKWFIFKSEFKDGNYSEPSKIIDPVSLSKGEKSYLFPFISPDESYLIFSKSVNDDPGDLFISYKKVDGSWTDEINLGEEINTDGLEICPMITPDGKYLFFLRHKVMWTSAKFIDKLRPK